MLGLPRPVTGVRLDDQELAAQPFAVWRKEPLFATEI